MITEEMLRSAARKADEQNTAYYERDFSEENEHIFPENFEKRIKSKRSTSSYPALSAVLRRVAVVALVIFLSYGAFSTANAMPREEFYGWISRNSGNYYVLNHDGTSSTDVEPVKYMLTFIPDGYTLYDYKGSFETVRVMYVDKNGHLLTFKYVCNPDETTWFIQAEGAEIVSTEINGNYAELLISKDPAQSSSVVWFAENNTAFFLTGFLDTDELIRVAESVRPVE